jgi:hypothetical protein
MMERFGAEGFEHLGAAPTLLEASFKGWGTGDMRDAAKLLNEYSDDPSILSGSEITVSFNTDSGNVFLSDDNYDVAMLHRGHIERFYNCPYCGHEGFLEDMVHDPQDDDCVQYMRDIGVDESKISALFVEDEPDTSTGFEHLGATSEDMPMSCELCGSQNMVTDEYGPQTICRNCILRIEYSKIEHLAEVWGEEITKFAADVKTSAIFSATRAAKAIGDLSMHPSQPLTMRTGAVKPRKGPSRYSAPLSVDEIKKSISRDIEDMKTMMTWHKTGSPSHECAKCAKEHMEKHLGELEAAGK